MTNDQGTLGIFEAELEGGEKGLEAVVATYPTLADRNVEIGPKEDVFTLNKVNIEHKLIIARLVGRGSLKLDFYRVIWYDLRGLSGNYQINNLAGFFVRQA